jgi:hypothetical protein
MRCLLAFTAAPRACASSYLARSAALRSATASWAGLWAQKYSNCETNQMHSGNWLYSWGSGGW